MGSPSRLCWFSKATWSLFLLVTCPTLPSWAWLCSPGKYLPLPWTWPPPPSIAFLALSAVNTPWEVLCILCTLFPYKDVGSHRGDLLCPGLSTDSTKPQGVDLRTVLGRRKSQKAWMSKERRGSPAPCSLAMERYGDQWLPSLDRRVCTCPRPQRLASL
jgi:hypothetical protein